MKTLCFLFAFAFALQVQSQPGNDLKITTAAATAARDSFTVYRNNIMSSLIENSDFDEAAMVPRYFELSKDLINALSAQMAEQGSSDVLQARLGIMFDANNRPFVTLIFESKNNTTQTSTYFDFVRPCPPVCPD